MTVTSVKTTLRCAIYTRVSSDSGLEQDFNSLDAQREASEAYIKSQAHEGWKLVRGQYNDGGFSGGSMDRPALQALLKEVRSGRIDIVVVYKVDRLTRSLADFAKLVETFDAHKVSFVSVTQSFNTTTSMGRLTLNVLLSFAQFEREVTGERIRDKIAASKRKGLWMGGVLPLGYRVEDRKLVVDEAEANIVRSIFERYCDLRSIPALQADLRAKGIVTRVRTLSTGRTIGGVALTNGPLAYILRNRMYLGEINHRRASFPGEHAAIVGRDLFDRVQAILDANRQGRRERRVNAPALLTGKIFDDRGNPMTPSYAVKKNVRYRYYVSSVLAQGRRDEAGSVPRVRAQAIEDRIVAAIREARSKARSEANETPSTADAELVQMHLKSIVVRKTALDITLTTTMTPATTTPPDADPDDQPCCITISWLPPVSNPRREVLTPPGSDAEAVRPMRPEARTKLIVGIATVRRWSSEIMSGNVDLEDLARREQCSERRLRLLLPLAFLAPVIVKAAVEGRLPQGLTTTQLSNLPSDWSQQRRQLGL